LASTTIILAAAALVAIFAFLAEANRAGPSNQGMTLIVDRGASTSAIGRALEQRGQVRSAQGFRIAAQWAYARGRGLQAGEYAIAPHASVRAIVLMMAEGRGIQHGITIPEGYTVDMVMDAIANSDVLTGAMPERPAEGSILPETYQATRGMTRAAILQSM